MSTRNFGSITNLFLNNLSIKQTILKNTFWLVSAEGISKFFSFTLSIFVARYLQASGYGILSFAFAFTALFSVSTDFGLSTLTIREIAKSKKLVRKYIDNLLPLKSILAIFTLILIFLVTQVLGKPAEVKNLIYLAGIFLVINSLITFLQSIFQGFEKMEYLAVSKLIYSISLFIIAIFIIWQDLGIMILIKGYVLSAIITFITVFILIRERFTHFWLELDLNFWRETLSEAWPFGLIGLLGSLYFQMNTIQVNLIAGDVETGWYSVSFQFVMTLLTLVNLFFASLFPTLSKVYKQSKKEFYRLLDYFSKRVIFTCFILCLGLFLISKPIILLLYGPGFLMSANIMRLLTISLFILFINISFSEALRIMNLQRQYLKALFWGVLLNFLLNFPLIYYWGALGASLTTIFSSSLITFLMIKKFKEHQKIDLPLK